MSPITVLLANGDAFFIGTSIAALCQAARLCAHGAIARSLLRIAGALGVVLVVSSSIPFSIWVYLLWLALWLSAFKPSIPLHLSFMLLSLGLCALEAPYHLNPRISVNPDQPIYIIGDSISAGLGTSERTWPLVLHDLSHLNVINLALPGATTSSALLQSKGITNPNGLVIVEIGGNDMLGDTSATNFKRDLDSLLARLPAHCAMFEIPLFPFHNGFGGVQRSLALRYHVTLIPKEFLTGVIAVDQNTLDGLHLSQKGHDTLARSIFDLFDVTHP